MKLSAKIICICIVLATVNNVLYAQKINTSGHFPFLYSNYGELPYTGIAEKASFQSIMNAAEGSPFYHKMFEKATISDTKNMFEVRYNAFLDEMELLNNDAIVFIDKKLQQHLISFPEKNLHYKVLMEKNDISKALGYFVQLEKDSYLSLYRKDRKKYVPARSHRTNDKAKFQNVRSRFYVEINNSGTAIPLPKNNREFAALFSTKRAQIEAFIKNENLKVRKEADVRKLIRYINSI